mmetsp:Transcript_58509/g.93014  ORF Transcript_58509/g.93014 Transcript_58509/m.93014 type:complete len:190 (-) Transcript_58509:188-757(-)
MAALPKYEQLKEPKEESAKDVSDAISKRMKLLQKDKKQETPEGLYLTYLSFLLRGEKKNAEQFYKMNKKAIDKHMGAGAHSYAYNPYEIDEDVQSQNGYIPAFSYGALPGSAPLGYSYGAQPAFAYQSGAASTDYAMMMVLALGVFMMICVLCFVVNAVMAAGCFVFGQRQSSNAQQGVKYRVVDHEEV